MSTLILYVVFSGGGLGGTRRGGPDENIRHSGRVEQWERLVVMFNRCFSVLL